MNLFLSHALDALFVLLFVLLYGRVAWPKRAAYFRGVSIMALATIIEIACIVFKPPALQIPLWVVFILAAPILEEALRITGLRHLRSRAPSDWLLFGLGFGLYEMVLKLLQLAALLYRNSGLPSWVLLGPLVPVFMHVGLSALAGLMLRDGRSPLLVFLVTTPLHALNNWRATEIMNETEMSGAALLMAMQGVVVVVFCAAAIWLSRRVTSAAPHANTPP